MQRCLALLSLLFLTAGIFSCSKIAVDGQDYDDTIITQAQAKDIFRECQDFPNHTQVAICIIEDGKVKFYGIKRESDTVITVDNRQSVFEIGSISKVFTATLLADFVLREQVKLDDAVNDYLEVPFNQNIVFSFQQLANHTSGLPRLPTNLSLLEVDMDNPYKDYGEEELIAYLTQEMQLKDQGKLKYSNLGAGLLAYTLAKVEGVTYEDLLQSRIFSKYHLPNSTTNRALVTSLLVPGLNRKGAITPNWDINVLVGAGGVLSSVLDLSNFALAQFDESNQVLALTRKATYHGYHQNGRVAGVGLGWMISDHHGKDRFWHNGGTGGYTSFMQIDIENRNGVIILTNVSAFSPKRVNIDALGGRLMESLEG